MRAIGGVAPAAMSASYHGTLQSEPQPARKPQPESARKAPLPPQHPGRSKQRPESKPASGAATTGKSSPDEDETPMKEHFARLVQEHDRLQVKYGRLRAHLVERECRKEQQQPGPKGPLAPIPEDEADSPDGELPPCVRDSPLLMGLHLEAQRLQQELRRAQRAYWDLLQWTPAVAVAADNIATKPAVVLCS
ncbi:uncharacterized protein LOC125758381 [Rhipicephalus sanguineus]|uniref:uncharacterized protein LOC125758381 n=1 Tax=Rhipicephalus sanguineus TaxID=34632 RepID=UPI0020C30A26|nr:uncharacterized protein LOC125758381 [Rhipicephalus sanguineus]